MGDLGEFAPQVDDDGGYYLGGSAAGADQLGALVVVVGARGDLEHHVAVADYAAEFAFRHGWLLSSAEAELPECDSDAATKFRHLGALAAACPL
ncbi:hypothetical protein Ato02nite_060330 [Paractinoplanes toevensis]|uniref:Uncharacterized protein n=1 Tax=Paractinoplanes toevensis TaxID=571911 RepID=A0A919TH09_9ACTN|nr:hypothetical protein Ato02nite_060330 [Actinoplanes toevensis]